MPNRSRSVLVAVLVLAAGLAVAEDRPGRDARRTPVTEVFTKCRDAVVNISTTRIVRMRSLAYESLLDEVFDFGGPRPRNRRVESIGSGVIVHESGYVVTNAHVVSQASDVGVAFADGQTRPAEVVAVDPEHDLAVLKIDAPQPLPALKLGRSDDIMVGETVIAIGNPLGLQHTVTAGIVSALNRELHFGQDVSYGGLIQTDAPINPGNSGGPLLNVNGEVIGINSAIRGDAQNIGFAIPADHLWELLPAMLDIERRERVRFGLRVGGADTKVLDIRADSPAARAELRPGDRIVAFNGQKLRDGIDYYVHLLGQKPDSQVQLVVQRGDKTLDVSIPLQSVPIPDGAALGEKLLGLELVELTDADRRRYELPDYVGLMVKSVARGGSADRVGIRATDLILRLDRVPVVNLQDVGLALERVGAGDSMVVEGLRVDARRPFLWTATLVAR